MKRMYGHCGGSCVESDACTKARSSKRRQLFLRLRIVRRHRKLEVSKHMNSDQALRKHLLELLDGGHAHATFDQVVKDFPAKFRGVIPNGLPHSAWMLLEHMRLAQEDILDFSRNPKYREMKWPVDYWPKNPAPANAVEWEKSIQAFHSDLAVMKKLVSDSKTDLLRK